MKSFSSFFIILYSLTAVNSHKYFGHGFHGDESWGHDGNRFPSGSGGDWGYHGGSGHQGNWGSHDQWGPADHGSWGKPMKPVPPPPAPQQPITAKPPPLQPTKPAATAAPPTNKPTDNNASVPIETKSLQELYALAKAEGCHLLVYAGGDTAGQQDWFKTNFEERFPGCIIDYVVDYSKFHSGRIDYQISLNDLLPDVVQLQTLQDFARWKQDGRFLNYKIKGWNQVFDDFKDPDGAFVGIFVDIFTNCVNKKFLPDNSTWPYDILDYLRPELKGHITITYPNDDDAVLYLFYQHYLKHGWDFLRRLKDEQDVNWVRGTQEPADALDGDRTWVAPAIDCSMKNPGNSIFYLPKSDGFQSWPQTAAIFKTTKKPASAKLYFNWILDPDTQKNVWSMLSTRKDVPAPAGFKPIWEYPSHDPNGFKKFMFDRDLVERIRSQVTAIIGEAVGEPSPGHPGRFPTQALPH